MSIHLSDRRYTKQIFEIFTECKKILEADGIFQWSAVYPNREIVDKDIEGGYLYNFILDGKCAGTITINTIQEEQYQSIKWDDVEGNALIIHRLAVSPPFQGKGIAKKLMDFAEDFALSNSFSSLRLDAYCGNPQIVAFYEKRGYKRKGEVYFPGRSFPFFCYEKTVKGKSQTRF